MPSRRGPVPGSDRLGRTSRQLVGCDGHRMPRICRTVKAALLPAFEASFTHQPFQAFPADSNAARAKLSTDARASVDAATAATSCRDFDGEPRVLFAASRSWPLPPCVVVLAGVNLPNSAARIALDPNRSRFGRSCGLQRSPRRTASVLKSAVNARRFLRARGYYRAHSRASLGNVHGFGEAHCCGAYESCFRRALSQPFERIGLIGLTFLLNHPTMRAESRGHSPRWSGTMPRCTVMQH